MLQMFVLALSLYNTWNRGVFLLCKITNLLIYRKEIIYQTQKSVDEDELTFKQSIAKSKECYVLLRVVRKIAKKKDKCEKQAIDNEFAIELDKDELKLFKGLFAEMFK